MQRFGKPPSYRAYTRNHLGEIGRRYGLAEETVTAIRAVSAVLPFRVNSYVLEQLIRWEDAPDDPIYQLTIPQEGMLAREDFRRMRALVRAGASAAQVRAAARSIQDRLNPHPAGQMQLNVPTLQGARVSGVQHKYRETVLFFPSAGQTCHAYCTYCFRWAQFVGLSELKFAARESETLVRYLHEHPAVTDVLVTGGDPLVMRTNVLQRYLEPLLQEDLEGLATIRIGTKAPAYWPYRFLTDPDADDLLRLFERIVSGGRHLAVMAHFSHPRELSTPAAREAIRRIRATGAVVRCQAPLIKHVNDRAATWAELWRSEVAAGAIPYYMFVERDTGPRGYFEVPLGRALEIFSHAYRRVSGLARTVRGPSMSATPGKVLIDGTAEIAGERHFVLKMLQARDPAWANRTFLARFDPDATWLDHLQPAFGETEFFFEKGAEGRGARDGEVARLRDPVGEP